MKSYSISIQENEAGELYLPLPDEALKELNWTEGTQIEWVDNKDGSWTIKKHE